MEPAKASRTKIVLVLAVLLLPPGLLLSALLGPLFAFIACGALGAALALTILTETGADTSSWDAETGLPDRSDAIRRLDEMLAQRTLRNRQGAVIVASVRLADASGMDAEERRAVQLLAALRMAKGLRKGDRILRVGETALAAILAPSRGLESEAVQAILRRIDEALSDPFRLGETLAEVEVSLGACLQDDAPSADGDAWLAAAEEAAETARGLGEPHLYWQADAEASPPPDAAEEGAESLRRRSA